MSFQVYMNETINCKEARNLPEDLIIKFVDQEALRMLKIRFDEYNMPHAFLMD